MPEDSQDLIVTRTITGKVLAPALGLIGQTAVKGQPSPGVSGGPLSRAGGEGVKAVGSEAVDKITDSDAKEAKKGENKEGEEIK